MAIEGNVGLAFGLVIAAGFCTCLGATMVFCTNLANHRVLSGALGASAGVMTYVSFVEIFTTKAVTSFMEAGLPAHEAARYATFAFFTGVVATWLLGKFTHWLAHVSQFLTRCKERREAAGHMPQATSITTTTAISACTTASAKPLAGGASKQSAVAACNTADVSTVLDVEQGKGSAVVTQTATATATACQKDVQVVVTDPPAAAEMLEMRKGTLDCGVSSASSSVTNLCDCCDDSRAVTELEIPKEENPEMVAVLQADHHTADLARMGLLTGLAVGLHNLPEGLATFVATLASPSAGIAIAVAIALHNIPEGVVVAMPIYYATKSKWKGFFWSFVSGVAEPIGGLIGYAILASNGMSPLAFAVMFAFVAGMMVYISLRELLPTALRYDPEDRYATSGCLWGMVVMAASLLLFKV